METDIATGLVWFAAFLFSTTVHEAMHALVAWKGGDPTAYQGGQVSLSPIPHIRREPIGMLAVPLLTSLTQGWAMGWASAPYDPDWAERYPRRAALDGSAVASIFLPESLAAPVRRLAPNHTMSISGSRDRLAGVPAVRRPAVFTPPACGAPRDPLLQ